MSITPNVLLLLYNHAPRASVKRPLQPFSSTEAECFLLPFYNESISRSVFLYYQTSHKNTNTQVRKPMGTMHNLQNAVTKMLNQTSICFRHEIQKHPKKSRADSGGARVSGAGGIDHFGVP